MAMEVGNTISRRTRRKSEAFWDEFYKQRHNQINKKSHPKTQVNSILSDEDSDSDFSTSSSDHDDGSDWDEDKGSTKPVTKRARFEDYDDDEYLEKEKKTKRKVGRPAKKKARVIEKPDFDDMLEDWSLKEKDLIRENLVLVKESSGNERCMLPLKFSLKDNDDDDDDKACLVKKTDSDEIDSLYDDLEMGLWESQVTTTTTASTENDECFGANESLLDRCRRGEHETVLDEQIGIICKYCLFLLLDIKHVLPPFEVETSPEKQEKKDAGDQPTKQAIMDQIQFRHTNSSNLESSIRTTGTVFDLIPESSKELYHHQLEGFEFLWRNIAGETRLNNLQRLHSNSGQGCIISHAPGTGKTRLTIVFLQTFLKLYPNCRPVIIAPRGMLLTWEQELKKWNFGINFHNLNESKLSDLENETLATVAGADQSRAHRKDKDFIRFVKLVAWMKGGSILGVGYRLFEELAGEKKGNNKFKKVLLELPGLLVMDEGHTPRNNQSLMWKALTKVRTRRRVILSGTPFQNNFTELYNTLCLVNPRFSNQFRRRGKKGNDWNVLTNSICKNSRNDDCGLKKLRSIIEPFVHVHKGSILQKTLPGMKDCLIILKPTDLQKQLLHKISKADKYLEQAHLASLISIHPSLVASRSEFEDQAQTLKKLESDPNAAAKTRFLINLIQLATRLKEKVLIFSEFIPPLHRIKSLIRSHFKWSEGREIMYMDGEIGSNKRQHVIDSFNDRNGLAQVMLASQRACSEGINLVGASRVVLLDVAWNPAVERQAICRAYRIGQQRMVYVYHLVTGMEVGRYKRQAEKERMSELVFQGGGGGGFSGGEDKVLEAMIGLESIGSVIERIVHQPKENDLVNTFGFVDVD